MIINPLKITEKDVQEVCTQVTKRDFLLEKIRKPGANEGCLRGRVCKSMTSRQLVLTRNALIHLLKRLTPEIKQSSEELLHSTIVKIVQVEGPPSYLSFLIPKTTYIYSTSTFIIHEHVGRSCTILQHDHKKLFKAAFPNHEPLQKWLVKPNLDYRDPTGATPLILVVKAIVESQCPNVLQKYCMMLVGEYIDEYYINIQDQQGKTALHWAVDSKEAASFLIDFGANPNIRDKNGFTPLNFLCSVLHENHRISKEGYASLKSLLDEGASPNLQDKNGCVPFYWLLKNWNQDFESPNVLHALTLAKVKIRERTARVEKQFDTLLSQPFPLMSCDSLNLCIKCGINPEKLLESILKTPAYAKNIQSLAEIFYFLELGREVRQKVIDHVLNQSDLLFRKNFLERFLICDSGNFDPSIANQLYHPSFDFNLTRAEDYPEVHSIMLNILCNTHDTTVISWIISKGGMLSACYSEYVIEYKHFSETLMEACEFHSNYFLIRLGECLKSDIGIEEEDRIIQQMVQHSEFCQIFIQEQLKKLKPYHENLSQEHKEYIEYFIKKIFKTLTTYLFINNEGVTTALQYSTEGFFYHLLNAMEPSSIDFFIRQFFYEKDILRLMELPENLRQNIFKNLGVFHRFLNQKKLTQRYNYLISHFSSKLQITYLQMVSDDSKNDPMFNSPLSWWLRKNGPNRLPQRTSEQREELSLHDGTPWLTP